MKYLIIITLLLTSCSKSDSYSLYRNSVVEDGMRIHVASFDVNESQKDYNQINCNIAAELFMKQEGVQVRYWCEKGKYKK